jgi:hypothetical protein
MTTMSSKKKSDPAPSDVGTAPEAVSPRIQEIRAIAHLVACQLERLEVLRTSAVDTTNGRSVFGAVGINADTVVLNEAGHVEADLVILGAETIKTLAMDPVAARRLAIALLSAAGPE